MVADFFPLLIVVVLAETFLSGGWSPIYFKFGIPLFYKSVNSKTYEMFTENFADELNNKFKSDGYTPSMCFEQIDKHTIAFREKMFELSLFSYTPLMHGKISLEKNTPTIKVIGLANWLPIVFIFFWYSPVGDFQGLYILFMVPILVFGFIYFRQRKKYIKICDYLSSHVHHPNNTEQKVQNDKNI